MDSTPRAYRLKASNAAPPISTLIGTFPHAIEKRVKDVASVIAKCKRDNINEFSQLHDIVGARVVCLFRSDMDEVGKLLSENFDVIEVDDKLSVDNNPLGYLSVHYACKIPSRYKGPRYENTAGVVFEIQVRTLCMHCWAAVSHYLDYKGDWDVPADLKRALSALSGLFYVADSEFEQFYSARIESKRKAEQLGPAEEINLEPIREVWIHDEAFAASRLSMMRIMARRTKAATVVA